MTVATDDIIRVTMNMIWDGVDIFQHVYHYKYTGTQPVLNGDARAALITDLNFAYEQINGRQSDLLTYGELNFYHVTGDYPMPDGGFGTTLVGTQIGTPLPTQACGLVIFRTATKRSIGKKFFPGFISADTADGTTFETNVQTALTAWSSNVFVGPTVGDGALIPGNYNATLLDFRPWISYVVRPGIYTQRRRRVGVGR